MSDKNENSNNNGSFAGMLDGVRVLNSSDKVVHEKPKPRPIPQQATRDEKKVMQELLVSPNEYEHDDMQPGDSLSYVRPGIQKQVFKKLKRGQYSIEAELDLHGLTREEAHQQLNEFILDIRENGLRCVRIIHGKGFGSPDGRPVLKAKLSRWLRLDTGVTAFCSAPPHDGGTGALYVLLKASDQR